MSEGRDGYGEYRYFLPLKPKNEKTEVVRDGFLPPVQMRGEYATEQIKLCCGQLPFWSRQGYVGLPICLNNKELTDAIKTDKSFLYRGHIIYCKHCDKYVMDKSKTKAFKKWEEVAK